MTHRQAYWMIYVRMIRVMVLSALSNVLVSCCSCLLVEVTVESKSMFVRMKYINLEGNSFACLCIPEEIYIVLFLKLDI